VYNGPERYNGPQSRGVARGRAGMKTACIFLAASKTSTPMCERHRAQEYTDRPFVRAECLEITREITLSLYESSLAIY
jgi:hypothetical protein